MEITVNPKFESLIPRLTDDEFKQLEENVLRDGITEPLVVWNGMLIDGHNRYKLAKKHGLDFKTRDVAFDSESDAEIWIIKNQFGRRNLSKYDRSILALRLKPVIAERAKENERLGGKGSQKSVNHKTDTQKEIAKLAGVSHDTIHRVETIEASGNDKVREKLRNGEISINEAYIAVTPKKKPIQQEVREARERHEEYQNAKNDSGTVVSFQEAKKDSDDVEIMGRGFYLEIMNSLKPIRAISLTKDGTDVEALVKTYDWEKRKRLGEMIDEAIKRLRFLRKVLTET